MFQISISPDEIGRLELASFPGEIHVIDSRYFTKNMVDYVHENHITDILFANNIFKAYSRQTYAKYLRFLTQTNGIQKPLTHHADSNAQHRDSIPVAKAPAKSAAPADSATTL